MALSSELMPSLLLAFGIVLVFTAVGFLQVAWLRSAFYQTLRLPLDGGRTFLGEPLFGRNKTVGGIVVLAPGAAIGAALLGMVLQSFGLITITELGRPLRGTQWLFLGAVIAFGYVLGELANSFTKRRLKIEPGGVPESRAGSALFHVIDQLDSIAAALLLFSAFVSLHWPFVFFILASGTVVHQLFNILLYRLGMKERAR